MTPHVNRQGGSTWKKIITPLHTCAQKYLVSGWPLINTSDIRFFPLKILLAPLSFYAPSVPLGTLSYLRPDFLGRFLYSICTWTHLMAKYCLGPISGKGFMSHCGASYEAVLHSRCKAIWHYCAAWRSYMDPLEISLFWLDNLGGNYPWWINTGHTLGIHFCFIE